MSMRGPLGYCSLHQLSLLLSAITDKTTERILKDHDSYLGALEIDICYSASVIKISSKLPSNLVPHLVTLFGLPSTTVLSLGLTVKSAKFDFDSIWVQARNAKWDTVDCV